SAVERLDLRQRGLDPCAGVHRHAHERQVLREGEEPLALEAVLCPEALGAPQQHAREEALAPVEVEQGVCQEAAAGAVALAEVGGELERVLDHSVLPRAAAPRPAARLKSTFTSSSGGCPSSPSRWVSSIHVEKVV